MVMLINVRFVLASALLWCGIAYGEKPSIEKISDNEIISRFVLLNGTDCKMPRARPPKLYEARYFSERNKVDLDGDGWCEIIDTWVDRVNPSNLDDNRRMNGGVGWKFFGNKWWQAGAPDYKPSHIVRDLSDKRIYYLVDSYDEAMVSGWRGYFDGKWLDNGGRLEGVEYCILGVCPSEAELRYVISILKRRGR